MFIPCSQKSSLYSYRMPLLLILLFSLVQPGVNANPITGDNEAATAITTLISGKQNPLLTKSDFSGQFDQLSTLYQLNGNQPLWLGKNRSSTKIEKAFTLLKNADADGLNPNDYDTDVLHQNFQLAITLPQTATNELAKFDTALSIALLRFINDLHNGRVKPQQFSYPSEFGNKPSLNAASLIKQHLDQDSLEQLPGIAAPQFTQYRKLKQVLSQYRKAPKEPNFEPLVFDKPLHLGDRHPQLAELRKRLTALGSLPAETSDLALSTEQRYSESLMEAVKEFQRASGLKMDGVIGQQTAAMLNQTTEQKILQVELAMERVRWLPEDLNGPLIIVNIPAYQLWAFNSLDDPEILNMKVIVGKAVNHQTPVLFEEMKYLEFMPYWNIPRNIMNKEILPKLYSDWGYLQSQDIELVQVYDDGASSWDSIFDDIRRGKLRARQRPGSKNPLGKVKFIFPNKADVYLHDTSTPRLFSHNRRDFSHGCVRVEKAEELAEFVLGHQPNSTWDIEHIREAMAGPKTRRVGLKRSIPVLFFYTTTFVDQDNRVHFYPDVYKQNTALKKALGIMPPAENSSLLTSRPSTSS